MRALLLAFMLVAASWAAGCADPGSPPGPGDGGTPTPTASPAPWTPGEWRDGACDRAPGADHGGRPDLIVHEATRLHRLAWDGSAYEVVATGSEGIQLFATVAAQVVAATGDGLLLLDEDLAVVTQGATDPPTGLASADGQVFVATRWNLTAYDDGLQPLGKVATPPPHGGLAGKAVDDIVVVDGLAYLVDDVVFPFFGFLVDVRDPAHMQVREVVEWHAGTTVGQWVDPAAGLWWIGNRFDGEFGTSSWVEVFEVAAGGAKRSGAHTIHSVGRDVEWDGPPPVADAGYRIAAATQVAPFWAVLVGDGRETLALVSMVDGPTRHCPVDVPAAAAGPASALASVAAAGDHLVQSSGSRILLWDVRGGPALAHEQDLGFTVRGVEILSPTE